MEHPARPNRGINLGDELDHGHGRRIADLPANEIDLRRVELFVATRPIPGIAHLLVEEAVSLLMLDRMERVAGRVDRNTSDEPGEISIGVAPVGMTLIQVDRAVIGMVGSDGPPGLFLAIRLGDRRMPVGDDPCAFGLEDRGGLLTQFLARSRAGRVRRSRGRHGETFEGDDGLACRTSSIAAELGLTGSISRSTR